MAVRVMGMLWGKASQKQKDAHIAMKTRQGKNYDNYRDPSKHNAERDNWRGFASAVGFKNWANKQENEDMLWYNQPRHQVQLLREAGLNPALMMNGNPFVPGQAMSYDGPDTVQDYVHGMAKAAGEGMSLYQGAQKFDPQMDLLNSQVNQAQIQNSILTAQAQYAKQQQTTNLQALQYQMQETKSRTDLNKLKQEYQRELNRDPLRDTKYKSAHKYEGIVTHAIGKLQQHLNKVYSEHFFPGNDGSMYYSTPKAKNGDYVHLMAGDKKYFQKNHPTWFKKTPKTYPWNKYKTNK